MLLNSPDQQSTTRQGFKMDSNRRKCFGEQLPPVEGNSIVPSLVRECVINIEKRNPIIYFKILIHDINHGQIFFFFL